MATAGKIYGLIGKAMADIGAIGKDSYNSQQKYKFRGIDAVYNALNPVLTKYGLFICPEILDQKREERATASGGLLKYTVLTMRYRVFADDGSFVEMTVVGEGMDSGDKSANKAMSVAMKYAMFQLFCIPTEEMIDPDGESFTDVQPKGAAKPAAAPAQPAAAAKPASEPKAANPAVNAQVTTQATIPANQPTETAESYRKMAWAQYGKDFSDPKGVKLAQFRSDLLSKGLISDKPLKQMELPEIKNFFARIYEVYGNQKVIA
jgi:hypothetical protein